MSHRILDWVRRRIHHDVPSPRVRVTVDDVCVTAKWPMREPQSLPWEALRRVHLRSISAGPMLEDVFWHLEGEDGPLIVPHSAEGEPELFARLQALPGFDNGAIVEAMTFAVPGAWTVWRSGPVVLPATRRLRAAEPDVSLSAEPLRRRLAETIAWCGARADLGRLRHSLRTPLLRPPAAEVTPASVAAVAAARAAALGRPVAPSSELRGGRLLVYFPRGSLDCGGAEAVTDGFLDVRNAPPHDTWVAWGEDAGATPNDDAYLLAWIPRVLLPIAAAGVWANPEGCLAWADEQPIALAALLTGDRPRDADGSSMGGPPG